MKTKKEEPDRVWFEFDKPVDAMHANEICVKANRMLARLSMTGSAPSQRFEWDETRKAYCYGSEMGYEVLADRGKWFNLDFFGRAP